MAISAKKLRATFPDLNSAAVSALRNALLVCSADETLELANTLLEGFGVEAVRDNEWSGYFGDIGLLYVNTGDTYTTTLLYDTRTSRYYVASLGDFLEKAPEGQYE